MSIKLVIKYCSTFNLYRWRPDQRALEEGRVAEAENIKLGVEQAQRDRRRQREHGQVAAVRTDA